MANEAFTLCCCIYIMMRSVVLPPRCKYSPSAYAGSGFWLNANSKRQAQHHVLPNCGRKPAPSSCEPTPRLPPELLPEDLWWAPSPGCPPPTPGKEVRPVLGVKTPFWDQGDGKMTSEKWKLASGREIQYGWQEMCYICFNAVDVRVVQMVIET